MSDSTSSAVAGAAGSAGRGGEPADAETGLPSVVWSAAMRAASAVPASLPPVGMNGERGAGVAQQHEQVVEQVVALGQRRVGEGAAGGIAVVGPGGDLGLQGGEGGVELGRRRAPARRCRDSSPALAPAASRSRSVCIRARVRGSRPKTAMDRVTPRARPRSALADVGLRVAGEGA